MNTEYKLNQPTLSLYAEKLTLEILCEHNGFSRFFGSRGWQYNNLANALGLDNQWNTFEDTPNIKALLQQRYQVLKSLSVPIQPEWQIAYQNINQLAQYLDLNDVEKAIFTLVFHIKREDILDNSFDLLGNSLNIGDVVRYVSIFLEVDEQLVKKALHKNEKLMAYGLIECNSRCSDLEDFLVWGNTLSFSDFLFEPLSEDKLLNRCLHISEAPTLKLTDFDHITEIRDMAKNYLKQAILEGKKGVNILIYGNPGTGKTEFATLLSQSVDSTPYNLRFADENEEMIGGEARLNSCVLAQKLLNSRKAMIIFDEIEDVFSSSLMERSIAQSNKAWINHFLETNITPIIWISNNIRCMDNAYIRRFDLVIEMPDLPIKKKAELISELVGDKLSQEQIQYLAKVEYLSPAVITRTFKVLSSLDLEKENYFGRSLILLNEMCTAQGFKKIEPLVESKQVGYSLDFISCKENIHKISEGLKRTKRGRICCYGAPGTGKTAWAKWLAQELEMQPLILQGSDLLDMYIGGTEQKIARAFKRAKEENCVLILDEVDTFLFARQSEQRSWEHSQVNEMLTQIEKFEGLMVVSTNLLEELDPAALRRFDLKIHFDYLKSEQRLALAKSQAVKLGLDFTDLNVNQIERLSNLTQGDFAAVARRHQFSPFENTQEWLVALETECQLKQGKIQRRIGF